MTTFDELKHKVQVLADNAWERRLQWPDVELWLENFKGATADEDAERLHALYLLSQFLYFGLGLVRQTLKAIYLDLYRGPIVTQIRQRAGRTKDLALIEARFHDELRATRFLGVGNPSESGPHLLYYFRQVNRLPKDLFVDRADIIDLVRDEDGHLFTKIAAPDVRHYVFIDDLLGSGTQIRAYLKNWLDELRRAAPQARVSYLSMLATSIGLRNAREPDLFGENAHTIFELDDGFRCFTDNSRCFASAPSGISRDTARAMAEYYGKLLFSSHPLGYKDSQLLLGFIYNTPDNTLPIIWFDNPKTTPWKAIFSRFDKVYS